MLSLKHVGTRLFPISKNFLRHANNAASSLSRLWIRNYKTKYVLKLSSVLQPSQFLRNNCSSSCHSMDICGKTAIVTGAASGIGYSIANCLLANKAKVMMVDIDGDKGSKAFNNLSKTYGCDCVHFYHGDVTCEAHQQDFFRKCSDCFGQINILINNASVWNETNWGYTVDVNFKAVMDSMLLSFQYMRDGLIMNISSTLAFKPNAASTIFSGTKRSVLGLSRCLSDSFYHNKYNNRICTLCPGITNTDFMESARKNLCTKELQEEFDRTLACECKQKPEVVSTAAIYLIQNAPHGSTWVVENGDLYMINFPHYKSHCIPKSLRVICDK